MKRLFIIFTFSVLGLLSYSQNTIFHKLNVKIIPDSSYIKVNDKITLPEKTKEFVFSLNGNLVIENTSKNCKLRVVKKYVKAGDLGMDRDVEDNSLKLTTYKCRIKGKNNIIELSYSGKIDAGVKKSGPNYQRGFSETSGIICSKGVYLAGSSYWIPTDSNFVSFELSTQLPEGWKSVSQGKYVQPNGVNNYKWYCKYPQEEIFLIAAPFTKYQYTMNNGVEAMAFLRTPDESLANKYLDVTEQYMEMYSDLIGKYPYSKFALVENFWETGYGMPSFTLLGEKIIRFPFILHSSYPHELLHNWWGNSVYVDFDKGNWCEGITAYLADHLIKEQHNKGIEYRRSTLKKFTDFVNNENDFPLSKFIARHDAPSEAIGYGKALMVWHMLRMKLGDTTFINGWRELYRNFKFKTASFDDIRKSMEKVSAEDLKPFFNQWINRTGAPEIIIDTIYFDKFGNSYRVYVTLKQIQSEDPFNVDVPVIIATKSGLKNFTVNMNNKRESYQLFLKEKPLKVAIDPNYDVFRKVAPTEVPPALSKIWASKNNVFILPSAANKVEKEVYLSFVDKWKESDNDDFEIVYDNELTCLPADKTPWILGFENKFIDTVKLSLSGYGSSIKNDSVYLFNKVLPVNGNSFVFTFFRPGDANHSYIFIAPGSNDAVPGLVRKLPHYGKYSYLAFTGGEPTNIAKGEWPVINSPLIKTFDKKASDIKVAREHKALATMKPVFSSKNMMNTIRYLSSDDLKGRGLGTPEIDSAAEFIAGKFKKYGLKPLGKSYYQSFKHYFPGKPGEKNVILKNVIAIIPGSDSSLKEEPVIVSAHYDHLGLGWPDVHKGDSGKIHHGADDNASGIAILLELAKNLAKSKPKRTIVFAAFSGEEAGLIGSRYFANHLNEYFKGKPMADVNIDTDGSLFDKKLMVLNGNTAREWKFIFMGTDYTTGIKSEVLTTDLDASDQISFIEKGIPAIQLFTGATENYHRPTDTWEKIDSTGLVKVAIVAKEVVGYLADRKEPMPFTGKSGGHLKPAERNTSHGKRASTGTVPDFAFTGKGVRVGSLLDDSPAMKAGLKKGDIIILVDNKKVTGLKGYTAILKTYKPGDKAVFTVLRNGQKKKFEIVFGER